MVFGTRKKKDPFTRNMGGTITAVDEDLLAHEDKQFISSVRELSGQYTAIELMRIEKTQRLFFLEDLPDKLAEEKRKADLEAERLQQQEQEIERKRAAAAVEARKQKAELKSRKIQKPAPPPIEKPPKTKPASTPPPKATETRAPEKVWLGQKGEKRKARIKQRSEENLQLVLDWVRHEPYTNAAVMALVLEITENGATKALDKMVDRKYLVRDEVPWVSEKKLVKIYGASQSSLHLDMRPDDVVPGPRRYFKRGTVKDSNGRHVLNIQRARLYYQRINNPNHEFRRYTSARDMPHPSQKLYQWAKYPDFIIENSHLNWKSNTARQLTIAVEVENDSKGVKYKDSIIKDHLKNISNERYDLVIYVRKSKAAAEAIEILFNQYIDELFVTDEEKARARSKFQYDSYDDLPERIKALGKWRS